MQSRALEDPDREGLIDLSTPSPLSSPERRVSTMAMADDDDEDIPMVQRPYRTARPPLPAQLPPQQLPHRAPFPPPPPPTHRTALPQLALNHRMTLQPAPPPHCTPLPLRAALPPLPPPARTGLSRRTALPIPPPPHRAPLPLPTALPINPPFQPSASRSVGANGSERAAGASTRGRLPSERPVSAAYARLPPNEPIAGAIWMPSAWP